jgi:hypothetical protein
VLRRHDRVARSDERALLAFLNGQLVPHEAGVSLGYSSAPEFNMHLASVYSSSRATIGRQFSVEYCSVHDRDSGSTFAIDAYRYRGIAPGGSTTRATGCGSLTITAYGLPWIDQLVAFQLNSGTAFAGFIVGAPATTPLAACPSCTLGVNGGTNPGVQLAGGKQLTLHVPLDVTLVGVVFAVQGFMFAPGQPCLSQLGLSDTVDLQIQ